MTSRETPRELTGANPSITPEMRRIARERMERLASQPPRRRPWWKRCLDPLAELIFALVVMPFILGRWLLRAAWNRWTYSFGPVRRALRRIQSVRGGSVAIVDDAWTSPDGALTISFDEYWGFQAKRRAAEAGPRLRAFQAGPGFNGPRGPLQDGEDPAAVRRFFAGPVLRELDRLGELLGERGIWILSCGTSRETALALTLRHLPRYDLVALTDAFLRLVELHAALPPSPDPPPPGSALATIAAPGPGYRVSYERIEQQTVLEYPDALALTVTLTWEGPRTLRRDVGYTAISAARDRRVLPCGFASGGLFSADGRLFGDTFDRRFYIESSHSDAELAPRLPLRIREELLALYEMWAHPAVTVDDGAVTLTPQAVALNDRTIERALELTRRIAAAMH